MTQQNKNKNKNKNKITYIFTILWAHNRHRSKFHIKLWRIQTSLWNENEVRFMRMDISCQCCIPRHLVPKVEVIHDLKENPIEFHERKDVAWFLLHHQLPYQDVLQGHVEEATWRMNTFVNSQILNTFGIGKKKV